jgi:hypothetical protein
MNISEPKVMQSAAGYYVGASCITEDWPDFPQPYDRYTGYYATAAEAEAVLLSMHDFESQIVPR